LLLLLFEPVALHLTIRLVTKGSTRPGTKGRTAQAKFIWETYKNKNHDHR